MKINCTKTSKKSQFFSLKLQMTNSDWYVLFLITWSKKFKYQVNQSSLTYFLNLCSLKNVNKCLYYKNVVLSSEKGTSSYIILENVFTKNSSNILYKYSLKHRYMQIKSFFVWSFTDTLRAVSFTNNITCHISISVLRKAFFKRKSTETVHVKL